MITNASLKSMLAPSYLDKDERPCARDQAESTVYGALRVFPDGKRMQLVDGKWLTFEVKK